MSSVDHPVAGAALSFSLNDEIILVRDELAKKPARIARTLIKNGALRVTLVGLHAGGELREHVARGPMTIHVLDGDVDVTVAGKSWPLRPGALLGLDGGVPHAVPSAAGCMFLLTVAQGDTKGPTPPGDSPRSV